jgi:TusA-related sulfurtransferase
MGVIELDIRGQICPSTLLVALKEMNAHREELRRGKVSLLFRTDNRDCLVTIPESAKNMGYSSSVEKEQDHYRIEIRGSAP